MPTRRTLLTDLMNPQRLDILKHLDNSPATFSELSDIMNISNSEVSRHLSRLTENKIIKKSSMTKKFELEPFGELINILLNPLDFIFLHGEYFQNHDLMEIPLSLLRDLDMLKDCELIEGTGNVMLMLQKIFEDAKNELWVMTDQQFPFGKPGLDVIYLVPLEMIEFGLKDSVDNQNRSSKAKTLVKIPISIAMVDQSEGMIFFPDHKGNPDYSCGFHFNNKNLGGVEFIKKIWQYFWDNGEIVKIDH